MDKQTATGYPAVNQQQPYPAAPPQGQQYQAPPGGAYFQQAPLQQPHAPEQHQHQHQHQYQPQHQHQPQHQQQQIGLWSSGLFDCFDDIPLCCLTCWCPCITFGRIAEIVDRGSSTCGTSGALYALILGFTGFQFIYSCTYRTKMRQQYGIPGDEVGDCCIHFWCEGCTLCQEYKELTSRGFDVALGWHGNMAMQNQGQGVQSAPMVSGGMTR